MVAWPSVHPTFDGDLFLQVFVTVAVIMDPLGSTPVFLVLTRGYTARQRRGAALQAVGLAAGVILTFALFGEGLLRVLGISLPSLQVAGGLLLVLVALELLNPTSDRSAHLSVADRQNVALVPLGTPLLAGPGAIATTIVYMRQADGAWEGVTVVLGLFGALALVYLALRYAGLVGRVLRENGVHVMSRIVGLLLTAIAVQLVAEGIEEWVRHGVR
jgi:multiple antibiotic resistance protein